MSIIYYTNLIQIWLNLCQKLEDCTSMHIMRASFTNVYVYIQYNVYVCMKYGSLKTLHHWLYCKLGRPFNCHFTCSSLTNIPPTHTLCIQTTPHKTYTHKLYTHYPKSYLVPKMNITVSKKDII